MIDLLTGTYNAGPPCKDEHSWLLEYIGKCQRGEIIVGHELKQEFDILLDLFDNPDVTFELADAKKRIKFIETKCKFYEAPFAGKPFIMQLFQKAFIEALYSFKTFDEEAKRRVRLFKDFLLLVARKNGKTPLVSAMNLAEFFCGPLGIKILCSSNDYEQADIMFQAIEAMREESPSLERLTRKNIKGIYFGNPKKPKHSGKFSYHNHGSIRKISAKTGAKEGRNIMVGSVDEVHEMKDNTAVMPIRQALSTQDEPIYGEITTEGIINDGYLDDRLKDARKVLNRELDRPRWLIWLYTQDSESEIWRDKDSRMKSNPGLGTIKKRSFLNEMLEEAQTNKKTRAFVLSKDFNIKQNNSAAWLTPQEYENPKTFLQVAQEHKVKDFAEYIHGCAGIGGVDLSETTDLTCARTMVMHYNDPHKYMLSRYFIPESKLDDSPDDVDYREWARKGLLTICPGNDNDFSLITQWYVMLFQKFGIRPYKIGYDNALAKFWVKEMEEIFEMERIPQKHETLSNPMTLLEADLKAKLVVYDNNPIDRWCLRNTAMDMNKRGLIMPSKVQGKPKNRIDGTATMVNCYSIYQAYKPEYMKLVG
jgi:phage terminase large subunit-like protein